MEFHQRVSNYQDELHSLSLSYRDAVSEKDNEKKEKVETEIYALTYNHAVFLKQRANELERIASEEENSEFKELMQGQAKNAKLLVEVQVELLKSMLPFQED